jgi:autotransporter-associated beta strand protein
MRGMFFVSRANDSSDTTTRHTLTLNGTITVPESSGFGGSAGSGPPNSSRILINSNGTPTAGNNTLGSGDVVVNGNVMLSNPAGTPGFDGETGGTFGAGYGGAPTASTPVSGRITFNGNIVKAGGAGTYSFHAEAWSNNAQLNPLRVQLNGQNTFDAAFIIAKSADPSVAGTITDANIQLGSSSIVSGGNIVSGPLGTGLVTVGGLPLDNYGNPSVTTKAVQASMEAIGGARTVANNFSFVNDAANTLTSSLLVQGSQDLTLSGAISSAGALGGGGGITKSGAATLSLSGPNTYAGDTRILTGTLAINVTSPATPWLADGADVYLTTGSTLALNFPSAGATDTIRSLYIDNVLQAAGTWGAPGSGAAHTTGLISGIGWLGTTVGGSGSGLSLGAVPEPTCLTLLMSSLAVIFMAGRRR